MLCPQCKKSLPEHKSVCTCGHKVNLTTTMSPPKRIGFINDYTNTLTQDEKHHIGWLLKEFSQESATEVVVVIVESAGDLTPEQYAYWLFRKWKLRSFRKTGFLILVCLKEQHTQTEIGYGFEKVVSEEDTERLLDEILIPHFKRGWIGSGLVHAVRELNKMLYKKSGRVHA